MAVFLYDKEAQVQQIQLGLNHYPEIIDVLEGYIVVIQPFFSLYVTK